MKSWKFKLRTDIMNVIKINKPNAHEIDMDRPDISRLINRGLKISCNIGKDEELAAYGKLTDTKQKPPGINAKVDGKSVAEIGF